VNTRKRTVAILIPLLVVLLLAACSSVEAGIEHAPVATDRETTVPLPTPATVDEAVLVDLRPLTTSGLARDAAWSPDGQSVAYTVLTAPPVFYREPPETQVWWSRADGSDAHVLAEAHSPLFSTPLFSTDGRTIYFLRKDVPHSGLSGLWAVDVDSGHSRELIPPTGGIHVHQLTEDGRLVLSERGTYAPLRLFDPSSGESVNLMDEHPSNHPEDANLSPDGTLLAYPSGPEVYLAEADGSNPQLLSENGGFGAHVWWSPDSRYLAYTTGCHPTDHLALAKRDGETLVTLLSQAESGYVSTLVWSSDSRWLLVATDAYSHDPPRSTRLALFNTEGNRQLLLEAYLHNVAWSADRRTLALSLWDGPQGELATDNVWLADLTDRATAAQLPQPPATPSPSPTPPLPLPDADLSPEDVIRRFWQAINAQDYRTAWAAWTADNRARRGLPRFEDCYRCIRAAEVIDVQLAHSVPEMMFQVNVKVDIDPACDTWMLTPGPFVVMERESPNGPWLIESFNTGP
jgi:Tol biopolymer transport system component